MRPRHCAGWFVPVRSTGGIAILQTGRLPDGAWVGIAFTTLGLLRAATGPRQEFVRQSEEALRDLLAPRGITRIQLDPVLVGPTYGPRRRWSAEVTHGDRRRGLAHSNGRRR